MPYKAKKNLNDVVTDIKTRGKKVIHLFRGEEKEYDSYARLEQFKREFLEDEAAYDRSVFDDFESVYRGTNNTRRNVNSKSNEELKKTNVVRNFTSELIEAKVDTSVPIAKISSKKPGMEDMSRMIEEKINSDMAEMPMDEITDTNERTTYKHGISITVMDWDAALGAHEYQGEKRLLNYHPKQVVPQAGVYQLDRMSRIHFLDPKTKDAIWRDYGVDVDGEVEEYPDANEISAAGIDSDYTGDNIVTQITRFYIDDEGDVGKFSWAGSTVIEDFPKYYYPRVMKCKDCGYESPQGSKECQNPECDSTRIVAEVKTEIKITEPMELSPITYPQKKKVAVREEKVDELTGETKSQITGVKEKVITVIKERIIDASEESPVVVPIPVPKFFPVAVRTNVPYDFSFRGRSDVELIRDLQETHKKVLSRTEDKLLNSSGLIFTTNDIRKQITNEVYQRITGRPQDIATAKVLDTKSAISEDLIYLDRIYDMAQRTIGISPSFQGQYDSSAKSGAAKQIQVNQTEQVLQAPGKNKLRYYSRIFKTMYWYDLNFTNEERPYVSTDSKGDRVYKTFDKYEMLLQDASGEWYFDTDFVFEANKSEEIPTDRYSLYQQIIAMAQTGLVDKEQFWLLMDSISFPLAQKVLEQSKDEQSDMAVAVLSMLKSMQPENAMAFLQLDVEQQLSEIQQALGKE